MPLTTESFAFGSHAHPLRNLPTGLQQYLNWSLIIAVSRVSCCFDPFFLQTIIFSKNHIYKKWVSTSVVYSFKAAGKRFKGIYCKAVEKFLFSFIIFYFSYPRNMNIINLTLIKVHQWKIEERKYSYFYDTNYPNFNSPVRCVPYRKLSLISLRLIHLRMGF